MVVSVNRCLRAGVINAGNALVLVEKLVPYEKMVTFFLGVIFGCVIGDRDFGLGGEVGAIWKHCYIFSWLC